MSFDVTTLALAKSYADQHGGGGGTSTAGDFIIKMTVEAAGDDYTVTSCDTTVEQIDAAVAAEKRVVLIASYEGTILELPMVMGNQGNSYYFRAFLSESVMISSVYKIENISDWSFGMIQIQSGSIGYSNDALPNVADVESALNKLVSNSHTHANKDALDKLSDSNGNLTYNGEPIGGENTIYIPAKLIQSAEDMPTIETSVTFEQVEAAYNLGREQVLKLVTEGSIDFIYMLPLVFAGQGEAFYFETIIGSQSVFVSVTPTNEWGLEFYDITPTPKEEIVNDVLAALPTWTGGSY